MTREEIQRHDQEAIAEKLRQDIHSGLTVLKFVQVSCNKKELSVLENTGTPIVLISAKPNEILIPVSASYAFGPDWTIGTSAGFYISFLGTGGSFTACYPIYTNPRIQISILNNEEALVETTPGGDVVLYLDTNPGDYTILESEPGIMVISLVYYSVKF